MHRKQPLIATIVGLTALLLWFANKSWAQPRPLWEFPLSPPPSITRGFEPPVHNWVPGHRGVDLRARTGQKVFAPTNGQVIYVSELAGRGVVVIKHGKLRTTYEPVSSQLTLGDSVVRGDEIGRLKCGTSHCCQAGQVRCLHWGLLRKTQYLNPLSKVNLHVRLLPIYPVLPRVAQSTDESGLSSRNTKHAGEPAQKPNAIDPSKRAYKVALLPNWRGQASPVLL